MKYHLAKAIIFTWCLAVFGAPSFAEVCRNEVPGCVDVDAIEPQKIIVTNWCGSRVALQIKGENAYEVGGHIQLQAYSQEVGPRKFMMGPPTPKDSTLPAFYTGLACCPNHGPDYSCPDLGDG